MMKILLNFCWQATFNFMPGKFQELNEMRNFVCDSFRADYVSIQHKIARKKKKCAWATREHERGRSSVEIENINFISFLGHEGNEERNENNKNTIVVVTQLRGSCGWDGKKRVIKLDIINSSIANNPRAFQLTLTFSFMAESLRMQFMCNVHV